MSWIRWQFYFFTIGFFVVIGWNEIKPDVVYVCVCVCMRARVLSTPFVLSFILFIWLGYLFIFCGLLDIFSWNNFFLELNRTDWLNIDIYSLRCSNEPCGFFWCRLASFCSIFWTISTNSFGCGQCSWWSDGEFLTIFSFFSLQIWYRRLIFLVNYCQVFYGPFAIVACDLKQMMKLTDLIKYNQLNKVNVSFFFLIKLLSLNQLFFMLKKLNN